MTDPLIDLWTDEEEAPLTETIDLSAIAQRAEEFEVVLDRRNRREIWIGGALAVFFSVVAVWSMLDGMAAFGLGGALLATGCAFVARQMHTRGRAPKSDPTQSTRDFLASHRAELQYQIDLLDSVAVWYLAPLAPGLLVFSLGPMALRLLEGRADVGVAVATALPILVVFGLTFGAVLWLNKQAVKGLRAELAALDSGGEDVAGG